MKEVTDISSCKQVDKSDNFLARHIRSNKKREWIHNRAPDINDIDWETDEPNKDRNI